MNAARATAMQPIARFVDRRLGDLTGIPRQLRWKEFIFHQGDEVRGLYRVEIGTIELGRLTTGGHEVLVAQFLEGDWFGEAEVLMGLERREYFARAVSRSTILPVPLRELSPTSFAELRQLAMDRLYRTQVRLADLVPEPPTGRIASILRHLSAESDTIRMSVQALAKAAGCPHETVRRTLHQLSEAGVVRLDRCVITILSPERLAF